MIQSDRDIWSDNHHLHYDKLLCTSYLYDVVSVNHKHYVFVADAFHNLLCFGNGSTAVCLVVLSQQSSHCEIQHSCRDPYPRVVLEVAKIPDEVVPRGLPDVLRRVACEAWQAEVPPPRPREDLMREHYSEYTRTSGRADCTLELEVEECPKTSLVASMPCAHPTVANEKQCHT